jgi:glycosyltransferase involved in cell wall biosynthesis
MKLSICIPIYNTDANELVEDLSNEIESRALNGRVEIIVIDDASEPEYAEKNATIEGKCRYIGLSANVGRSKIRNLFAAYADGEYMLFMDGDSKIPPASKGRFISNYISAIGNATKCICGGRIYPKLENIKGIELNYLYGTKVESVAANKRQKNPNRSFMTNNFVISKEIFVKIPFDERLKQYGHEDTLFGIELMKNNIAVDHIYNPVLNGHIETNPIFLQKTIHAVENLHFIYSTSADRPLLARQITLLKWAQRLEISGVEHLFLRYFNIKKEKWRQQFIAGDINLIKFDLFKLGIYLELKSSLQ